MHAKIVRLYGGPLDGKTTMVEPHNSNVRQTEIGATITLEHFPEAGKPPVPAEYVTLRGLEPWAVYQSHVLGLKPYLIRRSVRPGVITSTVGYLIGELMTTAALEGREIIGESVTISYEVDKGVTDIRVSGYGVNHLLN